MKAQLFSTQFLNKEGVLVFCHVCNFMFTFRSFTNLKLAEKLAWEVNELRYLPLPYGLLANELVENLDTMSLFPGITRMHKYFEDVP